MGIDAVNLSHLDLNLLVHLDALLRERSVTRAAGRVGIGQSAMSHNLARLRDLFGDELLTRGPDGLRLTPRAVMLVEPVRTTLSQIQTIVSRDDAFDPATAERTFRFGLPDSMEILVLPALLARLREVAPGVHLRLYNIDSSRLLDDLDADELDLAIGYDVFLQGQIHHKRRLLFNESYLCMFNAEITGITDARISLEDYVRLPHVLTSLRPGRTVRGVVDDALEKLGLRRTVVLTTPRFLTVPALVARAPVVVTMHARLARLFATELELSLSQPPVDLQDVAVSLLWHASYDHDPSHAWLRQILVELVSEL
ncbi:LysR family transcriptional regulator [Bradyrhizobium japonicum]|uniref:LysR family transcriptional regulator n=1 Tax=Bradyrhizobium japonicum TaxID=375 RepID=UPI00271488B4|nr:LysR family transcriptional regulator [Bradyrhizobium japonicum]WLB59114.1 LysR family transcriptional regulator [Bradyrhizobium japonicum]WLB67805.1 LysR family transcriptional regulator [Bradyrhizobium japonicum]